MVPTRADTEDESTAGEQVDLGRLLGDECRLTLGKDEHAGRQLDPGRVGSEEPEQHERLVERIVLGVRAVERRVAVGVVDAEHVVVGGQPNAPEGLRRLGVVAHGDRIVADLRRREHGAEAHHRNLGHHVPESRATTGAKSSRLRCGIVR